MANNKLDIYLLRYIERSIIPMYDNFDEGHDRTHVEMVLKNSLDIANHIKGENIDKGILYTAAAYHDTGLSHDRKIHHLVSGKIVRDDKKLLRWFNAKEIEIIAQACEDHRASNDATPRSIYGKIVADADRSDTLEMMIERAYKYSIHHFPELTEDEHFDRVYDHMHHKFGRNGYVKYHLEATEKVRRGELNEIYNILDSEKKTRKVFDRMKEDNII